MAGHAQLARKPVDVGPKAHPLDGALHPRAYPAHETSSRSTWYALA